MTEQELQQQRNEKWRLDARPIRTLDEAREWIEDVGFCTMYPMKPPVLLPTFIGAYAGSDDRLPTWQHAFSDPRTAPATELMVRMLRERVCYETNLYGENNFLMAASVFPYFYSLVGDRNPRQDPKDLGKAVRFSQLSRDAFGLIQKESGPVSRERFREILGGDLSSAALDRALNELWSKLKITRVDYNPKEGPFWDALYRWSPSAVKEGSRLSIGESISALISKYLDCVVAAEQREIENFFINFLPKSKVRESINMLLGAREVTYLHVGVRPLLQMTPRKQAFTPKPRPERAPLPASQRRIRPRRESK